LHAIFGQTFEAFLFTGLVNMEAAPKKMPHDASADEEGLEDLQGMLITVVLTVDDHAFWDAWRGEYCDNMVEEGVEGASAACA